MDVRGAMGQVGGRTGGRLGGEPLDAGTALELLTALSPAELAELFAVPMLVVDLVTARPEQLRELVARQPPLVLVGVGLPDTDTDPADRTAAAGLDVVTSEIVGESGGGDRARDGRARDDEALTLAGLERAVAARPRAAVTLVGLLRASERLGPLDGLVAESLAYSMLLAGAEFAGWLSSQPTRAYRPSAEPVRVRRDGATLRLTMNRPEVRNAYDTGTRDALVEALRAARADPTLDDVVLDAAGPAYGAGGDLSQFGTTPDLAAAHLVRTGCNAGGEIVRCPHPVVAYLLGACVGAGIEVPAFADHVVAAPDTTVLLPELGMGLVPGAGGTVSVTRRIGRRRANWLMLTGSRIDAATALRWGLVDEIGKPGKIDNLSSSI